MIGLQQHINTAKTVSDRQTRQTSTSVSADLRLCVMLHAAGAAYGTLPPVERCCIPSLTSFQPVTQSKLAVIDDDIAINCGQSAEVSQLSLAQ